MNIGRVESRYWNVPDVDPMVADDLPVEAPVETPALADLEPELEPALG